jgi:hypothetical protein
MFDVRYGEPGSTAGGWRSFLPDNNEIARQLPPDSRQPMAAVRAPACAVAVQARTPQPCGGSVSTGRTTCQTLVRLRLPISSAAREAGRQ